MLVSESSKNDLPSVGGAHAWLDAGCFSALTLS